MVEPIPRLVVPEQGGVVRQIRLSAALRTCAGLLAALYVLMCVFKVLAFNDVVQSVYKTAFLGRSFSQSLVILACSLEAVLAIALVYEFSIAGAALVSVAYSSAACLLHAYVLWTGELEPIGCAGRVLKPVEGLEHHILLLAAGVMLFLSTALYLGAGRRVRGPAA